MPDITLINNTKTDVIRMFRESLYHAAKSGEIPEELSDLFSFERIVSGGSVKLIINELEDDIED